MGDIDGEGMLKDGTPLKSATGLATELAEIFPQYTVDFLHGKMKTHLAGKTLVQ